MHKAVARTSAFHVGFLMGLWHQQCPSGWAAARRLLLVANCLFGHGIPEATQGPPPSPLRRTLERRGEF